MEKTEAEIVLPKQENFFSTEKLRRSARAQLYLGDNLYVLRGLPSESIDLIYIDPPFFSNRTYTQIWGDDNEVRSFGDIFQDGMFSYLAWLNARLWEMKRVLKPTGSARTSPVAKCVATRRAFILGVAVFVMGVVSNFFMIAPSMAVGA